MLGPPPPPTFKLNNLDKKLAAGGSGEGPGGWGVRGGPGCQDPPSPTFKLFKSFNSRSELNNYII